MMRRTVVYGFDFKQRSKQAMACRLFITLRQAQGEKKPPIGISGEQLKNTSLNAQWLHWNELTLRLSPTAQGGNKSF